MAGQRVSRLRKVALTGALTPGLILGAAGFGILPGGVLPTGVTAQSVIDGGAAPRLAPRQRRRRPRCL